MKVSREVQQGHGDRGEQDRNQAQPVKRLAQGDDGEHDREDRAGVARR